MDETNRARRGNNMECSKARNSMECPRTGDHMESSSRENGMEYSRRGNSAECSRRGNSAEYSRRENSAEYSSMECPRRENGAEYSSIECPRRENSAEYSRRENSAEYSRRGNSAECSRRGNSAEYSRRENSAEYSSMECPRRENSAEYSSMECPRRENSAEYSSMECPRGENSAEYSRRENSADYSGRENSIECSRRENGAEYSRTGSCGSIYMVMACYSTGGHPDYCCQVGVRISCDSVVTEGQAVTHAHHGDVQPLPGFEYEICQSAFTAGPVTSRQRMLPIGRAVDLDDQHTDVRSVCVVTLLLQQRHSELRTGSCGTFCLLWSGRYVEFLGPASLKASLHILCVYRAQENDILGETRSIVRSYDSGRHDLVRAFDWIPKAGVSQDVSVFISTGSGVCCTEMAFSFLDEICLVIMVVMCCLSNVRSRTKKKKRHPRCDGSTDGISEKLPHYVKCGKFQIHVKGLTDQTLMRHPFTRAASADAISDLLPLKMCSEKRQLWKQWAKMDPAHCLGHLAVLQCIANTTYMPRTGPHEVEIRPVTRFLPDATRDPSKDLVHVGYRLATLSAFPAAVDVSRIRLADAGFYSRGQRDEVICYSCRLHHSGWRPGDDPLTIHRHRSPQCEHVLQRDRELSELTGSAGAAGRATELQSQVSEGQPGAFPSSSQGAVHLSGRQESGDSSVSQPQPAQPCHQQPSLTTACASAAAVTVASCNGTTSAIAERSDTASSTSATSSNNGTNSVAATHSSAGTTTSASRSSTVPVSSASTASPGPAQTPRSRRPLFPQPRLQLGNAIHPSQCNVPSRRRTFTQWNESQAPPVEQLVVSGFFYAGYGDCVVCFYCGIRLKEWRGTDNVYVEHVRHRPSCGYMREIKGDDYIRQVQGQLQTSGSSTSAAAPTATPSHAPSSTASGVGNSLPGATSGLLPSHGADTGSQGATAPPRPASSAVVTSPLVTASSSSSSMPASPRQNREAAIPRPESAVAAARGEGNDGPHCRECHQRPVDTLVMPCAHLVLCEACAGTVRVCPLCRGNVESTAKVYMD